MRRRSIELSVVAAFVVLLISRSVILPPWASQVAPLLAGVLIFAGTVPHIRQFRIPQATLWVFALVATYVAASAASGITDNFIKSLSIGFLWFMAFFVGINVDDREKSRFYKSILIFAALETGLAVCETLIGSADIRTLLAATQDGTYTVRPNTILGPWTNRAQGTIGYPIPLGHFLAIALAVVIFSALRLSTLQRVLGGLVLFGGILLTGTRSGIAAAVALIAAGVLFTQRGKYSGLRFLVIVVLGAFALIAAVTLLDEDQLASDGSFTHRVGVLTSIGEILRLPAERVLFGSGLNSHEGLFELGYLGTNGTFAVDNGFVTLLIYAGIFGLGSFFIITGLALRRGTPDEVAIIAGSLTFSMTYDFVNWHLLATLFFGVVGLALSREPNGSLKEHSKNQYSMKRET
ncbi:O-antigen ligase [Arthrobacter sp. ISL-5]|uniref:O-antigen ligase family protein n=1 Tax=Arthrobacter sp. ISL-5 TaxID=2819111 RepID=UPI001BE8E845|nr:O-antigen ligase family protein [Arthrobacter sp. ISL-5]MBT2552816.1 hypothetical protein [Arthrobacter sp. ISL-5]